MTQSEKMTIQIGCNIDNEYAPHAAVMLRSVLENIQDKNAFIEIYILHKSLLNNNKRNIITSVKEFNCRLNFIRVNQKLVPEFRGRGYISSAAFYRIFLPYLLKLDKILYLDADIIVRSDITELWKIPIGNNFLAAIKLFDSRASDYYRRTFNLRCKNEDFFNSGVMLMNLAKMRNEIDKKSIIQFSSNNKSRIILLDQDILNAFFHNSWLRIPIQFNVDSGIYFVKNYKFTNYSRTEFYQAKKDPRIIHFTGPDKPWKSGCYHPLRKLYSEIYERTSFKNTIKLNVKLFILNKIKFIVYKLFSLLPDKLYGYIYYNYL